MKFLDMVKNMRTHAACALVFIFFVGISSAASARHRSDAMRLERIHDRTASSSLVDHAKMFLGEHVIRSMEELVSFLHDEADHGNGNEGFASNDDFSEELLNFSKVLKADSVYGIVKPWTLVPRDQQDIMYSEIARINANNISGAVVECGVWSGGSSMMMMYSQIRSGAPTRNFWLYDTYEGHEEPDMTKDGQQAHNDWKSVAHGADKNVFYGPTVLAVDNKWIYAPLSLVRNNVRVTGYPLSHVHFVKGKVEETLPRTKPQEPIALLRLDTDFYHSTKAELEHLYPLLVSGGMLIIDDYCGYQGSRVATDEYFASIGTSVDKLLSGRPPCPAVPVLTKP